MTRLATINWTNDPNSAWIDEQWVHGYPEYMRTVAGRSGDEGKIHGLCAYQTSHGLFPTSTAVFRVFTVGWTTTYMIQTFEFAPFLRLKKWNNTAQVACFRRSLAPRGFSRFGYARRDVDFSNLPPKTSTTSFRQNYPSKTSATSWWSRDYLAKNSSWNNVPEANCSHPMQIFWLICGYWGKDGPDCSKLSNEARHFDGSTNCQYWRQIRFNSPRDSTFSMHFPSNVELMATEWRAKGKANSC
jgi:hypothetical protein